MEPISSHVASLSGVSKVADTVPSIAKMVKSCMGAFQSLSTAVLDVPEKGIDTLGQMSPSWTTDTLDRFKLWSQNIGAHHTGRRSLDYRLRDASNIREQAIHLVGDMIQALDDGQSFHESHVHIEVLGMTIH